MIKKLKIVFILLNLFTSLIVMADINDDIQRKQAQDRRQLELIFMLTLKKSLTLFLIFSHLNAFVLGGVSNVYAANQVVDTTND
jgi:FtsH-binding integral membrane protein